MTYGEVRDQALHLIHQKSIAGETIPGTYDNQQDYVDKIPGLINAAEMDLATTVRKIPEVIALGRLRVQDVGDSRIYRLPNNAYRMRGTGLLTLVQGEYRRYNKLRLIGVNKFALHEVLPDDTLVEYYRYPERLGADPEDDCELDNEQDAQELIPLYVAAHLVMQDDAFQYSALYNEYQAKKSDMTELLYTEPDIVSTDEYNFWGGV